MKYRPELDDLLDYSLARLWSELDETNDRLDILNGIEEFSDLYTMIVIAQERLELRAYERRLAKALSVVVSR